jgi:hypothetical protein
MAIKGIGATFSDNQENAGWKAGWNCFTVVYKRVRCRYFLRGAPS